MKNINKDIPTEEEVTKIFRQIQPKPNPDFYQKMELQPWNHRKKLPFWSGFTPLRVASTVSLVLFLIFGAILLSPNLNTIAQRFSQFFSLTPNNQMDGAITSLETRHPMDRFTLTISEAETLAGFNMNFPSNSVQGFDLLGATYDELREAIILHYNSNSGGLVLRVSQQQVDQDYQGIGPEAVVEMVSVGPFTGEFVSGGWMIPEVESGAEAIQNPKGSPVIWNQNVNLQTLRWSDGTYLYELILAGSWDQIGYLDKDGLIDLANRMY